MPLRLFMPKQKLKIHWRIASVGYLVIKMKELII